MSETRPSSDGKHNDSGKPVKPDRSQEEHAPDGKSKQDQPRPMRWPEDFPAKH